MKSASHMRVSHSFIQFPNVPVKSPAAPAVAVNVTPCFDAKLRQSAMTILSSGLLMLVSPTAWADDPDSSATVGVCANAESHTVLD